MVEGKQRRQKLQPVQPVPAGPHLPHLHAIQPTTAIPPLRSLQSGYLLREAPARTWLPLLGCIVAAAAGAYMRQRRLEWAALGGALSFVFTVWQVGSASRQGIATRHARWQWALECCTGTQPPL